MALLLYETKLLLSWSSMIVIQPLAIPRHWQYWNFEPTHDFACQAPDHFPELSVQLGQQIAKGPRNRGDWYPESRKREDTARGKQHQHEMFRKKEQERRRKEPELAASVTGQGIQITPSGRHDYKTPQVCWGPLPSSFPARTDLVASVHGSCQETISCHLSDFSVLGKIMSKNYRKCLPSMMGLSQL